MASPRSARRAGEHSVAVRVFLSRKQSLAGRCGVRGQLRSPFKTSVSWKTLPGLPPHSSGLFRKHLDIVGEILQLPFALGGPVTKAYSSHLGCLLAR